MASVHGVAHRAKSATKQGAANPWLEFLERTGYVIRGVLYAVMGVLALGLGASVGVLFGVYPAHRASQLDPVTALRAE